MSSSAGLSETMLDERVFGLHDRLVDLLPAAVYVCDADGKIVRFNRRSAELWGRAPRLDDPAERFCGSLRMYRLDGGPLPHAECPMAEVLRTGDSVHGREIAIERPDGSRVVARVHIDAIKDDAGSIVGAVNCFHDVTGRKRVEQELRSTEAALHESEVRFEGIVAQANAGIAQTDLTGRFVLVNERYCDMVGFSRAELSQMRMQDITHPEDLPRNVELFENLVRTGTDFVIEKRYVRKDGTAVWVSNSVLGVKDSTGKLTDAVAVSIDITERRQTEEVLGEQTRRLDTLNRISRSISGDLDLERIVQTVTDSATELSGAKFGSFFYNVTDEGGESYVLYTLSGAPREAFEKFGLPRNTAVFEPTFRGTEVIRSDDIRADPRYGRNSPHFGMPKGHLPVVSYLAVPVISRSGEVLGGLFFGHDEPGVFTEEAEDIVAGIAAHAAIAIDNARLLQAAETEIERRRRVEAALHESERRSRDLLGGLPVAVYTTDAEGRVTFYNQAAVELAGRTPELGSDAWCVTLRLYRPDGTPLPHDECPMAEALKEDRPIRGAEIVAERPDGARVPVLAFPTPLRDESGALVGAVNALVDITERNRTEQTARRLASIVESSDDAIISKDLDGVIATWNRGAERIFGYTAEEAIGKPVTILIPPDRHDEEPSILERIRRGESIEHYETVRRRKDGTLVDISLTVSPVRNAKGAIIGASKIARDISWRRTAEEHRKMLLEELNHRVKNTLAIVQALAAQTLRGDAPIAQERDAFESRLVALSKLHELLTEDSWQGAALRDVLLRELAPYGAGASVRFIVDGPNVRLKPKEALALGMAVHELATNAAKYGALSNATGRVRVAWDVENSSEPARLRLRWSESGGPPVETPRRKGFGSLMIERGLTHDLGGEVWLLFEPGGVTCAMDIPLPDAGGG